MSKFIELTTEKGEKVLININHIFEVSKEGNRTVVKMTVNGYHNCPYYYLYVQLPYESLREMLYSNE